MRRAFTPCLLVTAALFVARLWVDAWWVEWQVDTALQRAAAQVTVEARNDTLDHVVRILDGYKRHVAAADAFFPGLDMTAIDRVRDHIDWYRLQTASIYDGDMEYDHWSKRLDSFLSNYELQDLRVVPPAKRRVLTALLWLFGAASVVTFFIKLSWHEWGET